MEGNGPALTATSVLRAITSIFTIAVSIITGMYIIRQKGYKRMLYLMYLCLIFSIALSGVAHLIQSFVINYIIWSEVNSTTNHFTIDLCAISRSFLNYASSFNILVITAIAIWLVKTSFIKTTQNEIDRKWRKIKKWIRYAIIGLIFFFPILLSISPLLGTQEILQGEYCELREIDNATTEEQKKANTFYMVGLRLWYGGVFAVLCVDTVLLLYCIIKFCWRLKVSHVMLKNQHIEILKDSLSLTVFVLIIYSLYCIELITALFLVILYNYSYILWGLQAVVIIARSIAILVMFFNPRMRFKMKLMPYVRHSAPLLNERPNIEQESKTPTHDYYSSEMIDSQFFEHNIVN